MKQVLANRWFLIAIGVLLAVGAVVYRLSLDVGFWTDDYNFLEQAGRLSFPEYLSFYFDPRVHTQWYRPMQGIMWWGVYLLSGREAWGSHLAEVVIHLINVVLLCTLVTRVTQRWRLGFLAGLLYLTLPIYDLAVNWPGVADPVTGAFYLGALVLWVEFLYSGRALYYGLALVATIGALLSKEIGVALPFTLVLVQLWLVDSYQNWKALLVRYVPFFLILIIYLSLIFSIVTQGFFPKQVGYGIGSHIFTGLISHMAVLAFPWGLPDPVNYLWLIFVVGLLVYASVQWSRRAAFLGVAALLLVLPILPFPSNLAQAPRYLYMPLMASAVAAAWVLDRLVASLTALPLQVTGAAAMVLVASWGGLRIGEDAVNFSGTARQARLQFRPIFQQRVSVEPDTLLYFVQPPFPTPHISGLMFQHYGPNVRVYGTDRDRMPGLSAHRAAFIYYRSEAENWLEQPVQKDWHTQASPVPPVQFGTSIALDKYELAAGEVTRGQAVILLLYWRRTGRIDTDYTVFAHLVDTTGEAVSGVDAPPHQGDAPTSHWRSGASLVDSVVIPVDETIPPGEYRIEIGLYDPATMERLLIVDQDDSSILNNFVVEPIRVTK